ncbi:hypothetical protein TNIN_457321 [Trichonephila inaurata madagascariensis]|uniref:Uncharacterized protein n=1 Tax=Trichonephila inaurata madagascariensis TaxID=2747483 RepID=A0A8X6X355_9ARAC|nr:hypothetical protein TNIN_457321 [Trichonephila inaurata madagascariensis]
MEWSSFLIRTELMKQEQFVLFVFLDLYDGVPLPRTGHEESKGEKELLHKTEMNHYKQDLQDIIGLGDDVSAKNKKRKQMPKLRNRVSVNGGQKKSGAKMRHRQGEMPEVEDSCECSITGVGSSAFQLTSTWNTPRSVRIVTPAYG